MDETSYVESLEPGGAGGSPDGAGGSKLPPVLANLMGSMGAGKNAQVPGGGGINVQEILTSIMVLTSLPQSSASCFPFHFTACSLAFCSLLTLLSVHLSPQGSPNSHPSEELLKQPDYSDKIKQMLGNQALLIYVFGEETA